jgi:hypothetical protein
LREDLSRLVGQARRLLNDLGASPSSRARLARDLGVGRDAAIGAQAKLERYLRDRYAERDGGAEGGAG